MTFEKFTGYWPGGKHAMPGNMAVGQVVTRNVVRPAMRWRLARAMRDEMENGKEFSVSQDGDMLAIRRDK